MMTSKQITDLADSVRIDRFTVFREYLQLVFLSHLYLQPPAGQVYFKGGTAIHLLLDSPRFSEDLDFSTVLSGEDAGKLIEETEAEMRREIPGIKMLLWHRGKQGVRFKLIYPPSQKTTGLPVDECENQLRRMSPQYNLADNPPKPWRRRVSWGTTALAVGLHKSADFKYPTTIRIDVSFERPLIPVSSPLLTKFPIMLFPIVSHLAIEEILAEKVRAVLTRIKGRDIFDLWFLLSKDYEISQDLVAKKIGRKAFMAELRRKIANFPDKKLKLDLNQFLPAPMRKITDLKQRLKVLL